MCSSTSTPKCDDPEICKDCVNPAHGATGEESDDSEERKKVHCNKCGEPWVSIAELLGDEIVDIQFLLRAKTEEYNKLRQKRVEWKKHHEQKLEKLTSIREWSPCIYKECKCPGKCEEEKHKCTFCDMLHAELVRIEKQYEVAAGNTQ